MDEQLQSDGRKLIDVSEKMLNLCRESLPDTAVIMVLGMPRQEEDLNVMGKIAVDSPIHLVMMFCDMWDMFKKRMAELGFALDDEAVFDMVKNLRPKGKVVIDTDDIDMPDVFKKFMEERNKE